MCQCVAAVAHTADCDDNATTKQSIDPSGAPGDLVTRSVLEYGQQALSEEQLLLQYTSTC
jgi:hypothetical protein